MSRKNMIAVIQCAAGKNPSAGHMLTENKQPVMFVTDPQKTPPDKSIIYKRPDDPAHSRLSWRDMLIEYNRKHKDRASGNPLGLLPAWSFTKIPLTENSFRLSAFKTSSSYQRAGD